MSASERCFGPHSVKRLGSQHRVTDPPQHFDPGDVSLPPEHLHELESWLRQREAAYPDLIPGTEKQITWHGPAGRQTDIAVVFIHGFSASRQELAPLPQQIASAYQANLYCTRLRGHGRGPEPFADLSPEDFLQDGWEALAIGRKLGKRVILLGSSTGGTVALWLAQASTDVVATVLLSPNFGLAQARFWQALPHWLLRGRWGRRIARQLWGPYFTQFEPQTDAHRRYWTSRYRTEGLVALVSFLAWSRKLAFAQVTSPCFMAYSPHDTVLDLRALQTAFARVGSADKQLLRFDVASGHVLAGDVLSPSTTEPLKDAILGFLQRVLPAATD